MFVASLIDLRGVLWLVSRLHTRSSSTRKPHSSVLREASLSTWAADSDARMSAASSFDAQTEHGFGLVLADQVWASIR